MLSCGKKERLVLALVLGLVISACDIANLDEVEGSTPPALVAAEPSSPPPPPEPIAATPIAKPSPEQSARFLLSASFGPSANSIQELTTLGYSDWIETQFDLPMRSIVDASWPHLTDSTGWAGEHWAPISEFYENAILGEDQLRSRATYALSQILVVSAESERIVQTSGESLARYVDILQEGAFGNYRDLLEDVTYSPVMGEYLTFAGNQKADLQMGTAPDENYAREIMQLFTIGLFELNLDGSLKLDANGQPIETYTTDDITELAKIFTGLYWHGLEFGENRLNRTQQSSIRRMVMHQEFNSPGGKTFLGRTIPESLDGDEAIGAALDILFEHPNLAPFISRQLIQRMTTSNPSPDYVERVATAFESGRFQLPNGSIVGDGTRGDMRAVWAAILLDEAFLGLDPAIDSTFGKLREPVLRFTHWARMANVSEIKIFEGTDTLVDPLIMERNNAAKLNQRPFAAPSVFNFYRPGYVAPGSETANAGLVAPELQITTEMAITTYANFMYDVVLRDLGAEGSFGEFGIVGAYEEEIALAENPDALVERLNLLLTAGTMTEETQSKLRGLISTIDIRESEPDKWRRERVQRAILIAVVSPEFLVQQ